MNPNQALNLIGTLPERKLTAEGASIPKAEHSDLGAVIGISIISAIVAGWAAFAMEPVAEEDSVLSALAMYRIGLRWTLLAAGLQVLLALLWLLLGGREARPTHCGDAQD